MARHRRALLRTPSKAPRRRGRKTVSDSHSAKLTQRSSPPDGEVRSTKPDVASLSQAMAWPSRFEDQVAELDRRFRLGILDADLFEKAAELVGTSLDRVPTGDRLLLKCRCVCAEILDLQGRLKEAQLAVKEGGEVLSTLQRQYADGRSVVDPRLAREQVRFVADFARLQLYRNAKFRAAQQHLQFCAQFVTDRLRRPSAQYRGTMGLVQYYLGCSERQLGRLNEADRSYGRAICEYFAKAQSALTAPNIPDSVKVEELALARHNTGVILGLGLGWTNSQRGNIQRALDANIVPAQALLLTSTDKTHQSYLSLLKGSIMRSLVGPHQPDVLNDASKAIQDALDAFTRQPYCHESYAVRAEYELALCALEAKDFRGARDWADRMEKRAKKLHDVRWQANAWIVRSRVTSREGRDPSSAYDDASTALKLMSGQEEVLGVIDANVARAEAYLNLQKPAEARGDLLEALRLADHKDRPNRKIEGVIRILLTRTYLAENEIGLAESNFQKWNEIKSSVEHSPVLMMAEKVERELSQVKQDFTVRWDTEELEHTGHDKRLRAWLVHRAYQQKREGETKEDVAKRLGLARASLNHWENELEGELRELRRRPSPPSGEPR